MENRYDLEILNNKISKLHKHSQGQYLESELIKNFGEGFEDKIQFYKIEKFPEKISFDEKGFLDYKKSIEKVEVKENAEVIKLKAQNKALSSRLEFNEDLIAELAMEVYD